MASKKQSKPAAKPTRSAPPAAGWREKKLDDAAKIKVLVAANPYKGKRAERFVYKSGMTVAAALEAGASRPDLRWDMAKGYVAVNGK